MKSAVENLSPTRVKLSVEVPFDELKPSLDAAYKKIAQQITIPGFRQGKVPAPIIDQRVGRDAVIAEAVNDALPQLYTQAIQENELLPLSQPEVDVEQPEQGEALTFSAELDVKASYDMPSYDDLAAEVADLEVNDDLVDEQMEALRERFGTLKTVERAAAKDDFVSIDLSAAKDGEAIEEAQAEGMSYQVGRGTMLEGLDESLEGMSADDETTFSSTLVGGEYRDVEVDVTVKVTAVKEQELPELDDEFAQMASEFDTMDELRSDVRDRVLRQARVDQAAEARDHVLEALIERIDMPLPESIVAEELQSRRNQLNEQLTYAGMTEADYLESEGQTEDEFAADLEKRVRDAMVAQFLLDDIADAQEIGVEQEELTQHLIRRAQSAGMQPEQFMQQAMQNNALPELMGEVRRGKALAQIVESADVKDASGNPVELKTLLPDGTYADPEEAEESAPEADASEGADAEPQAAESDEK